MITPFQRFKNLLLNPNMNTYAVSGTSPNWNRDITSAAATTYEYSIDEAQKIKISASPSTGVLRISQTVSGFVAGNIVDFSVFYKTEVTAGTFLPRISITAVNSSDAAVSVLYVANEAVSSSYIKKSISGLVIPATAVKLIISLQANASVIGSTGSVWYTSNTLRIRK